MLSVNELTRRFRDALNAGDVQALSELLTSDATVDWSRSLGTERGVYAGREGFARLVGSLSEVWGEYTFEEDQRIELAPDAIVIAGHLDSRGAASGAEVRAQAGQLWRLRGGLIARLELHQSPDEAVRSWRAERLGAARLYFVCEARPNGEGPGLLLDAALRGGADIVQLRDKDLDDDALVVASARFREAARDRGALFILNDRPDLVTACEADGVHVGQDDIPVAEARALAGPGTLVGLSTHSREQLDAANAAEGDARPDQISVGPVWETPTKSGRPATGLELIRYAAVRATIPWFAIGGIDASNVGEVAAAGAERVVVVRAIRDAVDPEEAARTLRSALDRAAALPS